MKTFNGILGLFLLVGLFIIPAPVQADYSLQDAVDIILTAVGSQSVDPGLSTSLGAAPGAIKSGLLFKCNQNRQRINDELMNNPPNYMQLEAEANRNQAIISAIYGDPAPLRKIIKERNKKIADQKKKKKAEERKEDKDFMTFQLDQYQKKIDKLKALKNKILKEGEIALGTVESSLRDAGDIQDEFKLYEMGMSSLIDRGEKLCVEAKLPRQKLTALAAAVVDGEALVNTKISLAKERKTRCKTAEDGLFVKNNYLAAQKALATIKKAEEAAFEYLLEINIKLEQIKKINKELSRHDSHKQREFRQKQKLKQKDYLKQIPQYLDQLEAGLQEAKGFPVKVQALKARIEDSKTYYIQYFPKARDDFDRLIGELGSIKLTYVLGPAWLSDLHDNYQREEMALNSLPTNRSRGFRRGLPSINCTSDKAVKAVMDEINEAFFRTVLVIKANQYLSNGCQPDSSVPPLTAPEETMDLPSGGGAPPNSPPVTTTSSNPPIKSTFGGLIIAGPTQITVGQGVSYVACDGDGQPYTTGSFSWNHSREDILVLPRSGNPVTGTAFKPGKVTMFVKYEGMKAYLDIEIKAKEESLFSSSGGEEDTDDDANLFSSSGGEEADSRAEVPQNNQFQQQCNGLVELIVWSLNRHDADSAQSYTNQAVALGCDINTAEVDHVVTQIHDIEKAEEQQREREKQQQAQRQTVPSQPQNQTNWMNVMNVLVQGMQGIQSGNNTHSRSPTSGSRPLPTADSVWQSHNPSSGNTGQSPGGNKVNGPECQGHTMYCRSSIHGWTIGNNSSGEMNNISQDKNHDGLCDFCGKSLKHFEEHHPFGGILSDERDCRPAPW